MPTWAKITLGVSVVVVMMTLSKLIRSSYAAKNNLPNWPDDFDSLSNLLWLSSVEEQLTPVVRAFDPQAYMSSAYRDKQVNEGVGGSASSYHLKALALDYVVSDPVGLGKFLQANIGMVPKRLRTYIAETTPIHGHFDFYGPNETSGPTRWLMEVSGGQFVNLR